MASPTSLVTPRLYFAHHTFSRKEPLIYPSTAHVAARSGGAQGEFARQPAEHCAHHGHRPDRRAEDALPADGGGGYALEDDLQNEVRPERATCGELRRGFQLTEEDAMHLKMTFMR